MIKNIVGGLLVLAISTGAFAVVKVYILESDITWIKDSLHRIETKLNNKCEY